ncbi:LysR family transcriptional regulator [Paraburkholderia sp. Ac-20336]|uniref:LysR family transcriptional regulator n=1 Tax=Burkholderiaceae TaxID=119060 RepID=UPI001421EB74|nr:MULTISPECIES: LysR substrate-binding domain-containing protein [Burkholderiaceae]MBN3803473.1 LysR family transcriptional regulator [Paraburkholderia sp. Ac-20336]MBN3849168.1 LysR family transcriptional regulator [Paraburkholderia sp. Ac-20342]NIF55864.1 LysR family transcriptional regulator [Burkholderia sp. Ax-1724]NIF79448.1 LysR family transcriptional regulator [Paraburkholderia sp. Cy-641]
MTLNQLRVFCTVFDQGGFRAASRSLDISQSTLTQSIQSLETELGVTLLSRSHQGVSLTPHGERLLARARAIISDCDRVSEDMQQLSGEPTGTISLGMTSEPLGEVLLPVLKRFMASYPRVRVHVSSGSSLQLLERIRDGRLDFAIFPISPQVTDADMNIERLYESTAGIIARKGHPKASATSIRELANCEWIGLLTRNIIGGAESRLVSLFRSQGLGVPKVVITAESLLETLHMVSETDYLTLEPRALVDFKLYKSSLISIPIKEGFDPREVCLVRRRNAPSTPVMQELITMMISYSRMAHRQIL